MEGQFLAIQSFPQPQSELIQPELDREFQLMIDVIRTLRNLRAEAGLKPSQKITAILQSDSGRSAVI
ncbi:class I tRNA ligase family protein [Synechococcus elongatus]|uniref:class I tRNA ligase family protein n=1 Tax=Synechococcus elongatus TaxID=32046 RepID=UPI0030D00002